MSFYFSGTIPASKSILNRLLILQSYSPNLQIHGDSDCDDVVKMKSALATILSARGNAADCGAAGTTFRFLALRASRIPGKHFLKGTERLLSRPQEALVQLIEQLGVQVKRSEQGLILEGDGWIKPTRPLQIDQSQSSQFASALLLNAWNLDFDLECEVADTKLEIPSQGYLVMTKNIVEKAGLKIEGDARHFQIEKKSKIEASDFFAEPDLSSAFSIAALGTIAGEVEIQNFPQISSQPDAIFPEILQAMGAQIEMRNQSLRVKKAKELNAIHCNLQNSPDLFPVLAVLCALAKGRSRLYGAAQLIYKESNRVLSTADLLRQMGCQIKILPDGLEIEATMDLKSRAFNFDPQEDHRLAMAAALAKKAGAAIHICQPEVVNKSFPEFWQIYDQEKLRFESTLR